MQADEHELMEQEDAELRKQVEGPGYDEEIGIGESEGEGEGKGEGAAGVAGAEEQGTGMEEENHQPKHVEVKRERVAKTSTLPSARHEINRATEQELHSVQHQHCAHHLLSCAQRENSWRRRRREEALRGEGPRQ